MTAARPDIRITAISRYVEDQSDPAAERYVFAYTVTIENHGTLGAQLIDRHWVITDANGRVQEVRGAGVVGEQPQLAPGDRYEYTSAAMLETPVGSMQGKYGMIDADGNDFDAPIPVFNLAVPNILH
ncbi:MAG: Co2+/Mg2+ efflux protein ApaG [Gammaproteobacteria bacterium]|nr:Co2+/Mg2+ efflux protein ApaG [Gammaproteobacteria bacterium]MCP5201421.1 Co2+/Mg2+ efflux protein ApaG [Gammaproteobacteria bacterium]